VFPAPPCTYYYKDVLTGQDRQDLQEALAKRFSEFELGLLLDSKDFDSWQNRFAGPYLDKLKALVDYTQRLGQVHWLVYYVDQARPGFDGFVTLRTKLTPPLPGANVGQVAPAPLAPAGPAAAGLAGPGATNGQPDPWRTVLLRDGRPFLDRASFRTVCQQVGESGATPILSVGGAVDTGKSYTARYLGNVSQSSSGNWRLLVSSIRLDWLAGPAATEGSADLDGLKLAQAVAPAVTDQPLAEFAVTSHGSEQDTTWAASTAGWIVSRASAPPVRWLLLDGFESTVLSPSAQAFLDALLAEVANQGSVRVALLGYRGNLSWCADAVTTAELDLADFSDPVKLTTHVFDFLLELQREAAARGRPALTREQVVEDARQVLGIVDLSAPSLPTLEAALTDISERVLVGV